MPPAERPLAFDRAAHFLPDDRGLNWVLAIVEFLDQTVGALVFTRLVPIRPDHLGAHDNRVAIETLRSLDLPVLLPWADGNAITGSWETHLRDIFRDVAPPLTIVGAGHFLQEDAGREIAAHIVRWMKLIA